MAGPALMCVLVLLAACSAWAAASADHSDAQAAPAPVSAVLPPVLPPYARHLLGADQWGACGSVNGARCTDNNCCSEWGYCGTGSEYCNSKSQSGYNGPGAGGGGGGGRACEGSFNAFSCNLGSSLCSRYGVWQGVLTEVSDCVCEDLCNDVLRGAYGPVPGRYQDTYCRIHGWEVPNYREISINGFGTAFCDPKKKPGQKPKPGRRMFQAPALAAADA